MSKEQRPEADVNIEFQSNSKMAEESQKLAWFVANANEKFVTEHGPPICCLQSGAEAPTQRLPTKLEPQQ